MTASARDTWGSIAPARILVAIGGSKAADAACRYAVALARCFGAAPSIAHVAVAPPGSSFDPPQKLARDAEAARAVGERLLQEARGLCGPAIPCTGELLSGDPATAICARAGEIGTDLIVVGSRGLGTIERLLLGSVSTAISARAPYSVLIVRERTVAAS